MSLPIMLSNKLFTMHNTDILTLSTMYALMHIQCILPPKCFFCCICSTGSLRCCIATYVIQTVYSCVSISSIIAPGINCMLNIYIAPFLHFMLNSRWISPCVEITLQLALSRPLSNLCDTSTL
jgi:hypothetical protein